MNWAVVAALVAAAASLTTTVVTVLSGRKSDLERWRRDTEVPIVARILRLSAEALIAWGESVSAREDWLASAHEGPGPGEAVTTHWQAGQAGFEALSFEAAQLDLVAGQPVRTAAGALVMSDASLAHWLRPASGASDLMELWRTENHKLVGELRNQLVATARTDLGIG
jgi:hypothetical protein